MATQIRQRQATPARWQAAAQRAITEGIEVRQVNSSGMWVGNSGTHANVAYVLEIVGGIVRSCSCPAGEFGDPVLQARRSLLPRRWVAGPGAGAPALAQCGYCSGRGWETVVGKSGAAYRFACQVCDGAGVVAVGDDDEPASPAADSVAVAPAPSVPAACGRCGGSGRLRMTVAGGCGRYAVITGCQACHGAGVVDLPAPAIAA